VRYHLHFPRLEDHVQKERLVVAAFFTLVSSRALACPEGRTEFEGACVRHEIVDFAVCIRNGGANELSKDAGASLKFAVQTAFKIGKVDSAANLRDVVRSSYKPPEDPKAGLRIVDRCYDLARPLPPPPPTPPPAPVKPKGESRAIFNKEDAVEIGQFGKNCSVDESTGDLVLRVTDRPATEGGQDYAGCCVEFRDPRPGGRDRAAVSIRAIRSERELHVKLESFADKYRVSFIHKGQFEGPAETLEQRISDDAVRGRVDKFCIVAKGQRGAGSAENVIRASNLVFR
jgi:hypothetical protein